MRVFLKSFCHKNVHMDTELDFSCCSALMILLSGFLSLSPGMKFITELYLLIKYRQGFLPQAVADTGNLGSGVMWDITLSFQNLTVDLVTIPSSVACLLFLTRQASDVLTICVFRKMFPCFWRGDGRFLEGERSNWNQAAGVKLQNSRCSTSLINSCVDLRALGHNGFVFLRTSGCGLVHKRSIFFCEARWFSKWKWNEICWTDDAQWDYHFPCCSSFCLDLSCFAVFLCTCL